MKKRILFVDDEQNILQGLRRSLRRMRNDWEMTFAHGGEEAIAHLQEAPFDAVISDMRMPSIDGAEVLNRAAFLSPGAIRFVLSGQADLDLTLRTIGVSHQFLAKPNDGEGLAQTLCTLFAFQDRIGNSDLCNALTGVQALPSTLLGTPHTPREEFVADPAVALRLLQLANSCYFDIKTSTIDPRAAADHLGADLLARLFEANLCAHYVGSDPIEEITSTSYAIANIARMIAESDGEDRETIDAVYAAGLLYSAAQLASPDHHLTDNLAACSAYLVSLWGLPEVVHATIFNQVAQADAFAIQSDPALYLLAARSMVTPDLVASIPDILAPRLDTWKEVYSTFVRAA